MNEKDTPNSPPPPYQSRNTNYYDNKKYDPYSANKNNNNNSYEMTPRGFNSGYNAYDNNYQYNDNYNYRNGAPTPAPSYPQYPNTMNNAQNNNNGQNKLVGYYIFHGLCVILLGIATIVFQSLIMTVSIDYYRAAMGILSALLVIAQGVTALVQAKLQNPCLRSILFYVTIFSVLDGIGLAIAYGTNYAVLTCQLSNKLCTDYSLAYYNIALIAIGCTYAILCIIFIVVVQVKQKPCGGQQINPNN